MPADNAGYIATSLGVVDVLDELLEEVLELLLVLAFGRPQPARASIPATTNERVIDLQVRQFIRGRLAGRSCEHRTYVSSSLVFSNLPSRFLHGNMILERTPNLNFMEAGI